MPRLSPWLSHFLLSVSVLPVLCQGGTTPFCKVTPSSPDWPSAADWQALNDSVSGNLIAPIPLGAVCHPDLPQFNNASCALLSAQWTNSSIHSSDPVSVDFNDVTCLPISAAPCSGAGYPVYVVKAVKASDIQEAVLFAKKTGVRLIVKGTGHDSHGRYERVLTCMTVLLTYAAHLGRIRYRSGLIIFGALKSTKAIPEPLLLAESLLSKSQLACVGLRYTPKRQRTTLP
jgi:hypothetical protein